MKATEELEGLDWDEGYRRRLALAEIVERAKNQRLGSLDGAAAHSDAPTASTALSGDIELKVQRTRRHCSTSESYARRARLHDSWVQ